MSEELWSSVDYDEVSRLLEAAIQAENAARGHSDDSGDAGGGDADEDDYDLPAEPLNLATRSAAEARADARKVREQGNVTFIGNNGIGWNMQFGASGPIASSRYITGGGGTFNFSLAALVSGAGTPIQAADKAIIKDDLVGHVTSGGDLCLDVVTWGNLEVWVGPLTGGRFAVSLFNRSPADDTITLTWDMLCVPATTAFTITSAWTPSPPGSITGSFSAQVWSHGVGLYILLPAA